MNFQFAVHNNFIMELPVRRGLNVMLYSSICYSPLEKCIVP